MSKKMKQFIMALLVIVMSVSILAVPAAAATEDLTAKVDVEIKIDGYKPAEQDTYKIVVTPGKSSFPMPAGGTNGIYEQKGEGIKELVFQYQGLGVYSYTITQAAGGNDNGYYDTDTVYDLTVYVLNAENPTEGDRFDVIATLKLRGGDNNTKPEKAVFVNKYAKPVSVDLGATKIYNNRTPKTGLFDFQLKNEKGEVLETVSNVGKNVTFSSIVYDEAGTHTYYISEINTKRSGVIYDKSVYTVTVEVTRDVTNKGDYKATVTYRKNGKVVDADDVIFVNKSETGGLPFTGDQFRLVLWCSIMVGSLVAVVVLLILRKKRRK